MINKRPAQAACYRDFEPSQIVIDICRKCVIIIDETDLYHLGASLKDLGKKWFAFSKMDIGAVDMLSKLKEGK